jgi:putative chitinase
MRTPRFNQHSAQLLKRAIDSGITSPEELSNLMGQTAVESAGFTRTHEDFRYRSADRAMSVVGQLRQRHTHDEVASVLAARDPEATANLFYDGRTDLGNTTPGDGWRFHGRGVIQLTGRANYETYGRLVGVDLIEHPELAADPEVSADVAVAYWQQRLKHVDRTDVEAVTRRINGGTNGYDERVEAVAGWATLITPELVEALRQETLTPGDLLGPEPLQASQPVGAPSTSTLRAGAHGAEVRHLQEQLHDLGYDVRLDGDFGNDTRRAVMDFQRNHDLAVDGVAGPRTLEAAEVVHRHLEESRGPYADDMVAGRTENAPKEPSIHDMFEALCQAGHDRDVDALCRVGQVYANTPRGSAFLMDGEQARQQATEDALAAQQALLQQQQEGMAAPQRSGPVLSL